MTVQTLAELKASNEAAERAEAEATAEAVEAEEAEVLEGEDLEQEPEESEAEEVEQPEEEGEESEPEEAEEWARPEKGAVPVKKHVEMKHKLKAELHTRDDEIAKLKAELEAVKSRSVVQKTAESDAPRMPKLSDPDIGYDDDKHAERLAEYTAQMVEYKISQSRALDTEKSRQEQLDSQVRSAVDQHYERALELVNKKLITPENYQAADHIVRKAFEEALPGMGEVVTDNLIARLGKGSEKVIYHLGINPSALSKLKESLKEDPTGFGASIYLGELKAKFNSAAIEKPKQTLKPDRPLNGGKVVIGGAKKAFDKAVASDDPVAIMRAKRAAKEKGIDTSNW